MHFNLKIRTYGQTNYSEYEAFCYTDIEFVNNKYGAIYSVKDIENMVRTGTLG